MTDYQNLKKQVIEINKRIDCIIKSIIQLKKTRSNLEDYKQKCLEQIQIYDDFVETQRKLKRIKNE